MKGSRTTDLQIRGMPVALRDKVRVRAAKKRQTMSQYLIDLIRKDAEQLSLDEWLDLVRANPIKTRGRMSAAQAVREAREARAEHLAHVFRERDRARRVRA